MIRQHALTDFLFVSAGPSLLHLGFLWLRWVGATLHCGVGLPQWFLLGSMDPGAWASVVAAQGLVAPRHVGSSQTKNQTRVLRIGRWILNHWTYQGSPERWHFKVKTPHCTETWNNISIVSWQSWFDQAGTRKRLCPTWRSSWWWKSMSTPEWGRKRSFSPPHFSFDLKTVAQ